MTSARRLLHLSAGIAMVLTMAACGDTAPDADGTDPSKLSAELEEQAAGIEERAAMAVRAAESAAEADLARLSAEAAQAVEAENAVPAEANVASDETATDTR